MQVKEKIRHMQTDKQTRIVLATNNAGKVRELAGPLSEHGIEVIGLADLAARGQAIADLEETGNSFAENALQKARQVAMLTGLPAVADDSGLEVDALGGRPGIYSARYSDDWPSLEGESRDARNIRKLLAELDEVEEKDRACRFVCCMAVVNPAAEGSKAEMTVTGTWEGRVLSAPQGENGFGYDPVFFDPQAGKSAAMMSREEKLSRSHRGKALRDLLASLSGFLARG